MEANMKEKIALFDVLMIVVTNKLGIRMSKSGLNLIKTDNGEDYEMDWCESDFISMPRIEYDGEVYEQIHIWGDGTLEFQNTDGDSVNWYDFDVEFLKSVLKNLA